MSCSNVTVAVVPRERFSCTERSLESILTHTPQPLDVICVDAGSPSPVREYLEQQAAHKRIRLVRTEHFLTPNAARNLALTQIRSKYVAFVDNDVMVSPGWLSALVNCAEESGAWITGPVYCAGEPLATRILTAGGTAQMVVEQSRRQFRHAHHFAGHALASTLSSLRRNATEMIEFHCALVRMDAFECLGPLDEGLMSAAEGIDLCLMARARCAKVFVEPASVVTYLAPPPFEAYDLPYFQLRWSHAWNQASLEHFRRKWELAVGDPGLSELERALTDQRRLALDPYRRMLRLLGRGPAQFVERMLIAPLEEAYNRRQFPYQAARPVLYPAA